MALLEIHGLKKAFGGVQALGGARQKATTDRLGVPFGELLITCRGSLSQQGVRCTQTISGLQCRGSGRHEEHLLICSGLQYQLVGRHTLLTQTGSGSQ